MSTKPKIAFEAKASKAFLNRELSWLGFARRVLAQACDQDLPLLERVKFVGILGMLHDEFFIKRISGLKRQINKGSTKLSIDGRRPAEELAACEVELEEQRRILTEAIQTDLRPALRKEGIPILDHDELEAEQAQALREYFKRSVLPILTPLAVDAEHPFPFVSDRGLNLAVRLSTGRKGDDQFVRIKVPNNRPRWIPLGDGHGFVPLEQVIAANLELMFPERPRRVHLFRVTRGAEGVPERLADLAEDEGSEEPGSIIRLVSSELKARRFAGVVRLQVDVDMPDKLLKWLAQQLKINAGDAERTEPWIGISDLAQFELTERPDLHLDPLEPVSHPRLRGLPVDEAGSVFEEIARGDILLHHPYHSFDSSVLRFLETAAIDPDVLAIKLTIYRTSSDSPIVRALAEAARRGKQVAVLVEITARFDEAPNIAWGKFLEREGVHVAYGVESLKTHVKLALVVREERGEIRRYAHVGTGNYHTGTARIYEDLGILTAEPDLCEDIAAVFNKLTGAVPGGRYRKMLVAPRFMRQRFTELIRREAEHSEDGRPCGIKAKMNQLQDPDVMRELYRASLAGVPIALNVRGLCCLRPGVPGLSENIRVFSVVGRFLEHSRVYRFENGGDPEYFIGSADWMKRNLTNRVETIMPVSDPGVKRELGAILDVYETDNRSAWDCDAQGFYTRRTPKAGEPARASQELFIRRTTSDAGPPDEAPRAPDEPVVSPGQGRRHGRAATRSRRRKTREELARQGPSGGAT